MSAFSITTLTTAGINAIAKIVVGSTLEFTKIQVGDGSLGGSNPMNLNALKNPVATIGISSAVVTGLGTATITGSFSNQDIKVGFFYRELGLFAKDPTTKEEILFAYGNAEGDAEWIPPSGESTLIEKIISIETLIGNAEKVTAEISSNIYVTKAEVDYMVQRKADLDNAAEDGGRLLASQMRFDELQTLYVDAAATAEGADGSEAKPFKTIQAAINARYMGAPVIFIKIKPGTYAEDIQTPRAPNTTWRFERNGEGVVSVQNAIIDNAAYCYVNGLTFNGPAGSNSTVVYVANTPSVYFTGVTINGTTTSTGVNFSTSRGVFQGVTVNNCGIAIAATSGAYLDLRSTSGTGNVKALHADGAIIVCDGAVPSATTPYEKVNGGAINVEGGASSFPSNFSQRKNLGDFTDVSTLQAAILAELSTLNIGETRFCWFANNIPTGLAQLSTGQRLICDITKTTDYGTGYGIAVFYSHHGAASGYWKIHNGAFLTPVPTAFTESSIVTTPDYDIGSLPSGIHTLKGGFDGQLPRNTNGTLLVDADSAVPWQIFIVDYEPELYHRHKTGDGWTGWTRISANPATYTEYGTVKLADSTALLSEADDATLTVDKAYELNDFRRMNTAYSVGDKVACAFRYEFFLECTQAGTTSGTTLDTRNVTHGQTISDGSCQWTVRTHVRSVNGAVADANGNVSISAGSNVQIADQTEAEAGTDNTKMMTPLRVKQAATKLIDSAFETQNPIKTINGEAPDSDGNIEISMGTEVQIASTSEAQAGTNDTKMMTPLKVRQAFEEQVNQLYTYSQTDLTAGSSALATGMLYFVYE